MKTEQEMMTELEGILGKENLVRLTSQLVARYGNKLEGVLMDALTHLDKNYTIEAAGELLEAGQFTDIDKISTWASEGEKPQLEFESQKSDSGVKEKEDYDAEVGLDFSESMGEYDE